MIDDEISKATVQLDRLCGNIETLNENIAQLVSKCDALERRLADTETVLDRVDFSQLHALSDTVARLDSTIWQTGQQIAILRPARRPTRVGKEPIAP